MKDRRRYPRASVALDVTVEAGGNRWAARTVDLSPHGVKVMWPDASVKPSPGSSVQVRFPVLDQHTPMSFAANVVRTDPDGVALTFPTLADQQFQRLKELVDSLLLQEWQDTLQEIGDSQLVTARAGGSQKPPAPKETPKTNPSANTDRRANHPPGDQSRPSPVERATPLEPVASSGHDETEKERLQALLKRRGLGNLQLPNGGLARQWREFLLRIEAEE